MGKLKIYPQWGTEMYESNHPSEKRGLLYKKSHRRFFFFFSRGLFALQMKKPVS